MGIRSLGEESGLEVPVKTGDAVLAEGGSAESKQAQAGAPGQTCAVAGPERA